MTVSVDLKYGDMLHLYASGAGYAVMYVRPDEDGRAWVHLLRDTPVGGPHLWPSNLDWEPCLGPCHRTKEVPDEVR